MSPELFDTYVDRLIGGIGIFILLVIALALFAGFYDWIRKRRKRKKLIQEQNYQDLVDSANRKIQVINRQIQSLDKCSKEIECMTEFLNRKTDSFIHTLQDKLIQYRETTSILKDIDGNIQKSVSVIKENPLLNSIEDLTGLLGKKADILMNTLEKNASYHEVATRLLKKIDNNIHLSATSVGESLVLLKKRDRNLQDEVSMLLSLEGKTKEEIDYLIHSYKKKSKNKFGLQFNYESKVSAYLDCSIDTLPIPTIGKRALIRHFDCENYEDVLSIMLIHQRKGLLSHIHYLGRKSIRALEDYFVEIGLLEIRNKNYYLSKICIPK